MKKLFLLAFMLATFISQAFAVAVVTGKVQDLGGNPMPGSIVRFTLRGCRTTPRVVGNAVPVRLVQDMVADSNGIISGTLVRNDEITCVTVNDTFYEISLVPAVPDMQPLRTKINTGSFDLSTAQDIAVASAPFTGLNVLLNPPASQIISQPSGTALNVVADGYGLAEQGSTNAEHGIKICNVDGSRCWLLAQAATTDPTYPAGSYILRTSDLNGNKEDVLACIADGDVPGSSACKIVALWQANTTGKIDFTTANYTAPIKTGTTLPNICNANMDLFILTNGTGGQKLNICNASGNGWFLVGDGGAASAVTSFNSRQGDVVPVAGDYSNLAESLTNKVIDSSTNQLITRTKVWLQATGCNGATASATADLPAASPATATCVAGSTNPDLEIGSLSFVDASTTEATFNFTLPVDFVSTSSVDVRLHWMQSFNVADPAQNVVWNTAITCVQPGQSLDRAWNTLTAITSASAAQLVPIDALASSVDSTNCIANSTMFVMVKRIGANGSDTMTGTAQLLGVEVTYSRNQ